jgi:putative membrane protein
MSGTRGSQTVRETLPPDQAPGFSVREIERPDQNLLVYYLLTSLLLLPLFPFVFLPRLFRYLTLRYRFDEEGVSMRWGVLFRREIHLTYSRIQDIHLSSNFIERWLELARVEIQTASGSAKAELTIEGVREFEQVRDFIYARMRGLNDAPRHARRTGTTASVVAEGELAEQMAQVTEELRAVRRAIERWGSGGSEVPRDV